jgi:dihydrolipoamide dehydrogenase
MVVGEFTQETDLVIIGGGPAGYSAAFRAAELGAQTVIVDSRPALGGVCLHDGCVPSKTLLHIAETINLGEHASQFGVNFAKPKIDFKAIRGWKDKTVSKLAAGLESLCKKHGVERIQGQAHFEDSRNVALLDASVPRIRFRRALLAVGASPKVHTSVPFDGDRILTAGEALNLEVLPASLLIYGGDYVALELATIFAALGSAVTLVHDEDRLLPEVDADLVRPVAKRLETRLKGLHSGISIGTVELTASQFESRSRAKARPSLRSSSASSSRRDTSATRAACNSKRPQRAWMRTGLSKSIHNCAQLMRASLPPAM